MHSVLLWIPFTILGIFAQSVVPGVDFLVPGLIVSLQEERATGTVWLAFAWLFLQEGMGNLPFGYGLLWYGVAISLFLAGGWMFEARNLLFMSLLGVALGLLHYALILLMASLRDWTVSYDAVMTDSVRQAIVFPLEWALVHLAYRSFVPAHAKPV